MTSPQTLLASSLATLVPSFAVYVKKHRQPSPKEKPEVDTYKSYQTDYTNTENTQLYDLQVL